MDADRRDGPLRDGPQNNAVQRRPRRLGWLIVVGCLAIIVLRSLIPETLGEQARRQFEQMLSDHYGDLHVEIGRGRFEPNVGMIFEEISLTPRGMSDEVRPLLSIDRIIAETDFDWQRVSAGEVPLSARRMLIDGLEATVWIDQKGKWSLEQLAPLPQFGPGCPLVVIRDARLRLLHDVNRPSQAVVLRDIDLRITKQSHNGEETVEIAAVGAGENVGRLELAARSKGGRTDWSGRAFNLRFERSLLDRLPNELAQAVRPLEAFDGEGEAAFGGRLQDGALTDWRAKLTVHEGRFQHPDFPIPIEQLRGVVHVTPAGVTVEAAQGAVGNAICRVTGNVRDWAWPCELDFHIWADSLKLDERFAASLPDELRDDWDQFLPFGQVNVDARLRYVKQQWHTDAVVQCKGVDVHYHKFPYPVRQLTGTIRFDDNVAWADDLRGTVDGKPLQCAFQNSPEGSGGPRWFEVTTGGPIAFDETLLSALTPRGEPATEFEKFVRSLAPEGGLHLVRARFQHGAGGAMRRTMDLRVTDGRMRYAQFPYPLYGVHGRIQVDDDRVRMVGFEARNGGDAKVHCDGVWLATSGGPLDLAFRAENLPLDQTLRSALPTSAQQTWDALAPSGALQRIDVKLHTSGQDEQPKLNIIAQQFAENVEPRAMASLRPTALPYRLDIVDGKVSFDGNEVLIDRLDGRHEGSRLIATGNCVEAADGRWLLDLDVLSGSRLRPDADLFAALPVEIRGGFQRLQLRGPVNVRGQTKLRLPNDARTVPETEWDLQLQLEGNRIGDVGPVHDIRGELSIRGQQNQEGVRADGVVHIDSMHYNDLQLTSISGPFSIRGETLQLGVRRSGGDGKQSLQPIRGKAFAGDVGISGEVSLSSGAFNVNTAVSQVVVPRLLADLKQPQSTLTGTINGQLELEGTIGAAHLLKGAGSAMLADANLYQLPQIVQLLTQLRIEPDEEVAFTDGKAEFVVSGDQVSFSQLQLWGDLVALHGSGTMNRMRELDLVFNTRVSPHNTWSRLIRPLGNQRYTLWTLSVRGPVDAPMIERNALDGVSETLERLFPQMSRSADRESPRFLSGWR